MRLAVLALACMLVLRVPQGAEPFVPVALEYTADDATTRTAIASDLQAVRGASFNAIRTTVRWRDVEKVRGTYAFSGLERTLDAAAQAGLRVIVRIDHTAPRWIFGRHDDAERRTAAGVSAADACFDHPGVQADLLRFIAAAAKAVARHRVLAVDVGSHPPPGLCLCPYTERRIKARPQEGPAARINGMLREDVEQMVRAASGSGAPSATHARQPSLLTALAGEAAAQDDWLMRPVVVRYGTSIDAASSAAARLALSADALGSGAQALGWWLTVEASVPERDRRLAAWTAISRGAGGLVFVDPPPEPGFAGIISRNQALFAQLVPRPSRVAFVDDPAGRSPSGAERLADLHRRLLQQNRGADILHVEQLSAETANRHGVFVIVASPSARAADFLRAQYPRGAIMDTSRAPAPGAQIAAGIVNAMGPPPVRIEGGQDVEVRFLESASVQMIVGLNHSDAAQRVTMTFPPETQEAIWQNMETGAGVNFISGATGPTYSYWFRPRDALVLLIRKDVR